MLCLLLLLPQQTMAPSDIASLPLYLFSPAILELLEDLALSGRGEYELQDAIQLLINAGGGVHGILVRERLTLTTARDLLEINRHFLRSAPRTYQEPLELEPGTRLIEPVYIGKGAHILPGCVIGPDVVIEGDCQVGENAHLTEAVVLRGARIPKGANIQNQVVT